MKKHYNLPFIGVWWHIWLKLTYLMHLVAHIFHEKGYKIEATISIISSLSISMFFNLVAKQTWWYLVLYWGLKIFYLCSFASISFCTPHPNPTYNSLNLLTGSTLTELLFHINILSARPLSVLEKTLRWRKKQRKGYNHFFSGNWA